MKDEEIIDIVQARIDGKQIEYVTENQIVFSPKYSLTYKEMKSSDEWDFIHNTYRVKPLTD